jgi:hypothetical protein
VYHLLSDAKSIDTEMLDMNKRELHTNIVYLLRQFPEYTEPLIEWWNQYVLCA